MFCTVDGRNRKVRHHYTADTGFDQLTKREQFKLFKFCSGLIDHRQIFVGVNSNITMPGKVLDGCHDALLLYTFYKCYRHFSYPEFIFSKTPVIDDWIHWVVVQVYYGRIVHMNAHALALSTHGLTYLVNYIFIGAGTLHQLPGKSCNTIQSHTQAPFSINGDHQGSFGNRLIKVGESCLTNGTALEETKSAHIVLTDQVGNLGNMIGAKITMGTDDHQLCDAFILAQAPELFSYPLFSSRCFGIKGLRISRKAQHQQDGSQK